MKFIKVFFYKFTRYCQRQFPSCANLCWPDDSAANQVIRSLLLYFYGLLLGALFWKFVLLNLGLSFDMVFSIGLLISLFLAYGCALSIKIRCYSSLCLIGFLGKSGRSMLKAVVLTFVLTGPINNISLNAREVVRVFTCSTVLTYNLSKVRFDLMTKPFQNALLESKENLQQVKDEFVLIVDIIEPIETEIEGSEIASDVRRERNTKNLAFEQYREHYVSKLRKRCEAQLLNGIKRCEQTFKNVYDSCHDKLPILVNYLLCWPMKLDMICSSSKMFGNQDEICSSEHVVDHDFGQDYGQLKHKREDLVGNLKDVNIQYEFVDVEQHEGYLTAKEASKQIKKEFNQKMESFNIFVFILRKMFAFMVLKIIMNALSYHQNYLQKIDFENYYVTDYFGHLDSQRARRGKLHILPLRRIERPNLVDLESSACTRLELRKIIVHFMTLLLQCISASVFIVLDTLITETLDIVSRNSNVEFKQKGHHDVNITVFGTGIIAMMVRRSIEGFKSHILVDLSTTNEECLPRPSRLETWSVLRIYLLLLGVAILVLNEAYINRLRRLLCAWFYPKREKQRILYLYNRILRRRKVLRQMHEEKLKEHVRKMKFGSYLNFLSRLEFYFPMCCGWIKIINRKPCSLCDYKSAEKLIECPSYNCFLVYCQECWQDINEICLACENKIKHICSTEF